MQDKSVSAAITINSRGQILAFLTFLVAMGGGILLLLLGKDIVGYTILVGDLVALVGGSVWNKIEDRKIRKLEERKLLLLEGEQKVAQQKVAQQRGKGKNKNKQRR